VTGLNGRQKGALLSTFRNIDSLLSQIKYLANDDNLRSPFSGYAQDLTSKKKMVIESHVLHIRDIMLRILEDKGIPINIRKLGVTKSINAYLISAYISIEDLKPYMRGFGKLTDDVDKELSGIISEVHSAIHKLKTELTEE
jgi:hypothetical protein